MILRGWDIEPTSPMGPSPRPSWNAQSHGHLHEAQPLYIHLSYLEPLRYTAIFYLETIDVHQRFVPEFFTLATKEIEGIINLSYFETLRPRV